MSTYDQILKHATDSEKKRLARSMKLRAINEGKYLFEKSKQEGRMKLNAQETTRKQGKVGYKNTNKIDFD